MITKPYWVHGAWVFDDDRVGLVQEPFVAGMPDIIDDAVAHIPDAREGFRLTFSEHKFPGSVIELQWVRPEEGGNWYRDSATDKEGWLCPALFEYFDEAPRFLYVSADAIS